MLKKPSSLWRKFPRKFRLPRPLPTGPETRYGEGKRHGKRQNASKAAAEDTPFKRSSALRHFFAGRVSAQAAGYRARAMVCTTPVESDALLSDVLCHEMIGACRFKFCGEGSQKLRQNSVVTNCRAKKWNRKATNPMTPLQKDPTQLGIMEGNMVYRSRSYKSVNISLF